MAKLFLSNTKQIADNSLGYLEKLGFQYYQFNTCVGSAVGAKKRKVDNVNHYFLDQKNFVTMAGTLIYRGKIGSDALNLMLEDFSGDNLRDVRKNMIGNYACVISKNGITVAFCDDNNLFNLFYKTGSDWCISNDLVGLNKTLPSPCSCDEMNIMEYAISSSLLDKGTIFKDIYKLMGDEYLLISKDGITVEELPVDTYTYESYDKSLKDYVSEVKRNTGEIVRNFDSITICQTGGFDSRTALAAYLSQGAKPELYYGVGDSPLTTTSDTDLNVVKLLAQEFELKTVIADWSTPTPYDKYWKHYWDRFGIYSMIYAGSKNVFESYESVETDFIDLGFFGETLRDIPWVEQNGGKCTLEEFINAYYIPDDIKASPEYPSYYAHIYGKFAAVCDRYGIDKQCMQKNDVYRLILHYRKVADAKQVNFQNEFRYSAHVFAGSFLTEIAVTMDEKYRQNAYFEADVIKELCPRALELPITSHSGTFIYGKNKNGVMPVNKGSTPKLVGLKRKITSSYILGMMILIPFTIVSKKYSNKNTKELFRLYQYARKLIGKLNKNRHSLVKIRKFDHYTFGSGIYFKLAHYQQLLEMLETDGFLM